MRNYIPLKNETPWVLNHNKWTCWNLKERNVNTAHKGFPTKKVRGVTSQWGSSADAASIRDQSWTLRIKGNGNHVTCYLTEGTNIVSVVLLPHARSDSKWNGWQPSDTANLRDRLQSAVLSTNASRSEKPKKAREKHPRSEGDTQWP